MYKNYSHMQCPLYTILGFLKIDDQKSTENESAIK